MTGRNGGWAAWLGVACAACGAEVTVPDDPALSGGAVGVQTARLDDGRAVEIWYPAAPETDDVGDVVDLRSFLPAAFLEVAPEITVPTLATRAVRDAEIRRGGPFPVVFFSHGFGGFRQQSFDLTTHLASRGYVVVSTDHAGRGLGDVVPCLLTSTIGDCSFGAFGDDPGPADLAAVLAWLDGRPDGWADVADLETIGVFGHSAGGGTTTAFANAEARVDAAFPMAGAGAFTRDLPSAIVSGSCDGIVPEAGDGGLIALGATAREGTWSLQGAGHLAFSDLCAADFGAVGDQVLARDDANSALVPLLLDLGTDGCPTGAPNADLEGCAEGFLPLETSAPVLRAAVAGFFDAELKGGDADWRVGLVAK
jgi:predicted dienelactone hydrolase